MPVVETKIDTQERENRQLLDNDRLLINNLNTSYSLNYQNSQEKCIYDGVRSILNFQEYFFYFEKIYPYSQYHITNYLILSQTKIFKKEKKKKK